MDGPIRRRIFVAALLIALIAIAAATYHVHADQLPNVRMSDIDTRILGQTTWICNSPAALRVIVKDHRSGDPLPADVDISLARLVDGKPVGPAQQWTNHTGRGGTLDTVLHPSGTVPGPYRMTVDIQTAIGDDSVTQDIEYQESQQILLTADKPVYQPGQIIHLRALALDLATHRPVANAPVTFEVQDGRGNKVFKQHATLSQFGIAGVDFQLADEVNMGDFVLRAILPSGQQEKTVRVERYVLPKYKVTITTDQPYYAPGETVHGTVKCAYFFGKPLDGANVDVDVNTIDIGTSQIGSLQGQTDPEGSYTFDYTLPNSFVGQPFEEGKAVVEFAATVKDTADHVERQNKQVPVVGQPVLIAIVPEHATLVPGLRNRIYVAAATPDGAPLTNATIDIEASSGRDRHSARLTTNSLGLASFSFTPGRERYVVRVDASDSRGRQAEQSLIVQPGTAQDGILLRSDKTFVKVGDMLKLDAMSTVRRGTIYFDVVHDGQTILTKASDADDGFAGLDLPITPDMAGTDDIHAYAILPDEDIVRDTRTIVVSPADDLSVHIAADQASYRPGDQAHVAIDVTDTEGRPTPAALGIAMVDESVFALSELQPGLEKVYFALEKELMEPRYEINGLSPSGLYSEPPHPEPVWDLARQRAGAMLLAANNTDNPFSLNVDTYDRRWAALKQQVLTYMTTESSKILAAADKYDKDRDIELSGPNALKVLIDDGYLPASDALDSWGKPYRVTWTRQYGYPLLTLTSAGPDGKFGTRDDVEASSQMFFAMGGLRMRGGFDDEVLATKAANGMVFAAPMGVAADATEPVPSPPMAMNWTVNGAVTELNAYHATVTAGAAPAASAEPRVRHYFPETLFWNPSLITDDAGHATLDLTMADSITTWRLSAMASGLDGALGSATAGLPVFQQFFADIDLPVALTQHDEIAIPVALYNYAPNGQDVAVSLKSASWFTLNGPATQSVYLDANQVSVVYFPITAVSIGKFSLEVTAKGSTLSDAIRRDIEVKPDGCEVDVTAGDRLEGGSRGETRTIDLPVDAVTDSDRFWVKIYPGAFSQVVEGLDGMLQMPGGCFEQTSSSTYPDVLILSYLKANKKVNPEIQMKAEQYINVGYQRLVTFECKSGGFSWFGDEPAHQVLTAYGLLEFGDMARVYDVDPAIIARTQSWLAHKQLDDGSWLETNSGIAEGIINRQTGKLRTTAYVAWALAESGYSGPELDRGIDYVKGHISEADDPYTLAVILNLLTAPSIRQSETETASTVAARLIRMAKTDDKAAYWAGNIETFTGADGEGADIETTGLAAYGLLKQGGNGAFVEKVLTYLVRSKDGDGTWGSTQGTVWSLKALLLASNVSVGGTGGTVDVYVGGQLAASTKIAGADDDVMRQIDVTSKIKTGSNDVKVVYNGDGALLYQIAGRYYLPWHKEDVVDTGPEQVMSLGVDYDKTTLAENDTATATATLRNNTPDTVEMPLIDLGVPPGFDVVPDGLDQAVSSGRISKYTLTARQIIIYLEKLAPHATVTLTYGLHAKFPVKALSPASRAYPYYNPTRLTIAPPRRLEITKS